jgi:hypothetical protein
MKTYNLIDTFELTVVKNTIHWVKAHEYYPELDDGTYTDQLHTRYIYGNGEVVGRIPILYVDAGSYSVSGGSSSFHKKLKALPLWFEPEWVEAPWFIYAGDTRIPAVQYTNSGRSVSLAEALYALEIAGYFWNPEIEGFERIRKDEATVNNSKTDHLQETSSFF